MLISPEQHADYQQGVVQQVARRLGLSEPQLDSVDELLWKIEQKDLSAFHAITQFKNTYRKWYETSIKLEQTVEAGQQDEAEKIRDMIRELRAQRDHQRKLLVGYLDMNYPSHVA